MSLERVLLIGSQVICRLLQKQHLSPTLVVHVTQNIVFLQLLHYRGFLSGVKTEKHIPQLIISINAFQLSAC